jgi:hypothetical protein
MGKFLIDCCGNFRKMKGSTFPSQNVASRSDSDSKGVIVALHSTISERFKEFWMKGSSIQMKRQLIHFWAQKYFVHDDTVHSSIDSVCCADYNGSFDCYNPNLEDSGKRFQFKEHSNCIILNNRLFSMIKTRIDSSIVAH